MMTEKCILQLVQNLTILILLVITASEFDGEIVVVVLFLAINAIIQTDASKKILQGIASRFDK